MSRASSSPETTRGQMPIFWPTRSGSPRRSGPRGWRRWPRPGSCRRGGSRRAACTCAGPRGRAPWPRRRAGRATSVVAPSRTISFSLADHLEAARRAHLHDHEVDGVAAQVDGGDLHGTGRSGGSAAIVPARAGGIVPEPPARASVDALRDDRPVAPDPSPTPADRASPLLRERVRAVFKQLPKGLAGDEEAIHQMRVAGRRLRVALPLLARKPRGQAGEARPARPPRADPRRRREPRPRREPRAPGGAPARAGRRLVGGAGAGLRRRLRTAARRAAAARMAEALMDLEIARAPPRPAQSCSPARRTTSSRSSAGSAPLARRRARRLLGRLRGARRPLRARRRFTPCAARPGGCATRPRSTTPSAATSPPRRRRSSSRCRSRSAPSTTSTSSPAGWRRRREPPPREARPRRPRRPRPCRPHSRAKAASFTARSSRPSPPRSSLAGPPGPGSQPYRGMSVHPRLYVSASEGRDARVTIGEARMRLLIVRHAIAVARGTPGVPDADRPLTPRGRRALRERGPGSGPVLAPPRRPPHEPLEARPADRGDPGRGLGPPRAEGHPRPRGRKLRGRSPGSSPAIAEQATRRPRGPRALALGAAGPPSRLSEDERLEFKKGGVAVVDVDGRLEERRPARGLPAAEAHAARCAVK